MSEADQPGETAHVRKRDPDPGGKVKADERTGSCSQRHTDRTDKVDLWKFAPGCAGESQRPGGGNL
ncbi:Uncharacterized protein DAT39_000010 [Clarias magur]|uniref:Uncharacterized protein n=1 Tax=Clarias magur TaxID=1594786 RepID=A0A8J5C9S9_CLAMG|nr:Uncharacterized protein DAT39_000010 [Clarias magur]